MLLAIILSLFTVGNALDIDIWVDKEDGIYYPNEKLTVYFQVDRECYLAVYDIEGIDVTGTITSIGISFIVVSMWYGMMVVTGGSDRVMAAG